MAWMWAVASRRGCLRRKGWRRRGIFGRGLERSSRAMVIFIPGASIAAKGSICSGWERAWRMAPCRSGSPGMIGLG